MLRPISTLNIPKHVQQYLLNKGFFYIEETSNIIKSLRDFNDDDIRKLFGLELQSITAQTLLGNSEKISVLSGDFDRILGGGIRTEAVTELCGLSGSGKTQLCLQLCVNVQLPKQFGGLSGHAVFIDTTSGFSKNRLIEIIAGTTRKLGNLSTNYLDNIHYLLASNLEELLSALVMLKKFLSQKMIKIVIIDTITHPFNNDDVHFEQIKCVYQFLSDLQKLAVTHKFAVVLTNDFTTRFDNSNSDELPALGEPFYHRINTRLNLQKVGDKFTVTVEKQSSSPIYFRITGDGFE